MLSFIVPFIQPLINFFGGPVIKGLVDAYKLKLDAGNTTERIATDLAAKELELQAKEADLNTQYKVALLGRWYEPVNLLGYIMVIYVGKVVVWDKVLALGSTDPIKGSVGDWAGMIIVFFVGKRTVENVSKILTDYFRRR